MTDTTSPATSQPVDLKIQDIQNATILIKVAIERGTTFKAEEMGEVSAVYAKLHAFVSFVQAQAEAESKAKAAVEAPEAPLAEKTVETKKTKKASKAK